MKTILVVDDLAIFRDPIAASLELAGFATVTAAEGGEALGKFSANKPDLVLLDVAMPGMDGPTFLRALRATPGGQNLPVIALSALSDKAMILQMANLGVRDYMLKSRFSMKELLERVRKCLNDQAEAASRSKSSADIQPAAATSAPSTSALGGEPPRLLTREQSLQRVRNAMGAKTLSGIVAQVISMAASPRGDVAQLSELIAKDPLLSARVLQAANSVAYVSARGAVTTVADAVRHIGCTTIRNIAATVGVFDAMPEGRPDGFNPIRCWQHSFGVATLCEALTAVHPIQEGPGAAYLAGLCHDLGELLFQTHFGREYQQVLAWVQQSCRPRADLEGYMLGMTRGDLALLILQEMGLPPSIEKPIEAFHSAGVPVNGLARVLRLADAMANGMLLVSGVGEGITPLTRAECRAACGASDPAMPDAEKLRSGIYGMTGLLGRLCPRDEAQLLKPPVERSSARVLLVRDPTFTSFDPVAAALGALSEVQVVDRLPESSMELSKVDAMVVVARSNAVAGLTALNIDHALAIGQRSDLPLLWLAGREEMPSTQGGRRSLRYPVPLGQVGEFLHNLKNSKGSASSHIRTSENRKPIAV